MRRKQKLALPCDFGIQKENWGNYAFLRDNKASNGQKTPYIALYFTVFRMIVAKLSLQNAWLPPIFFLDFNSPC